MSTRIQKIGLANGVKPRGRKYNLSKLIEESYKVSYKAKDMKNKKLIELTESHLANIKADPTNKRLSEDLDVLKDLVKIGKDQKIKDLEEVADKPKKRRMRSVNSCVKPATEIKESSWSKSRKSMTKALKGFRESAKSKLFYKEFDKFNKTVGSNPITMAEAVNLYKASNSCLTHLTVTLEKNPEFRTSFRECTKLLSRDNHKLLESIQKGKLPSKSLLESFITFTNILLESNAPEELDPELYEDADLETMKDRDVINEDADMEELDDRDVINEDADMEELDDRDVINEDAEVDGMSGEDTTTVDLTPQEIEILKSVLGKISSMTEVDDIETVEDEEVVPEIDEDEEIDPEFEEDEEDFEEIIDDEELEEDEFEDEEFVDDEEEIEDLEEDEFEDDEFVDEEELEEDEFEDEEFDDEELEEDDEPCPFEELEKARDAIDYAIDKLSDEDLDEDEEIVDDEEEIEDLEEDADMEELDDRDVINEEEEIDDEEEALDEEDELEDFETKLSESAVRRIKKCF